MPIHDKTIAFPCIEESIQNIKSTIWINIEITYIIIIIALSYLRKKPIFFPSTYFNMIF